MVFSKKWLKNHSQFLLHFLIYIDVLMLCRKFELISTKNFRVTAILKKEPIFEKYPVLIVYGHKALMYVHCICVMLIIFIYLFIYLFVYSYLVILIPM